MKNDRSTEKLGSCGSWATMEKHQHPGNSAHWHWTEAGQLASEGGLCKGVVSGGRSSGRWSHSWHFRVSTSILGPLLSLAILLTLTWRMEDLTIPMGWGHWGAWLGCAHVNNIHLLKSSLTAHTCKLWGICQHTVDMTMLSVSSLTRSSHSLLKG